MRVILVFFRAVLDIFGVILGYGVPFSNRLVNGTRLGK
jgi:hypothetical protein